MGFLTGNWEWIMLALYVIEKVVKLSPSKKDDVIFDPFLGSGTTTLTSSEIGYKSIGIEQNPFLYYLSKVKCSNFASLENFNSYFDQFNKRRNNFRKNCKNSF